MHSERSFPRIHGRDQRSIHYRPVQPRRIVNLSMEPVVSKPVTPVKPDILRAPVQQPKHAQPQKKVQQKLLPKTTRPSMEPVVKMPAPVAKPIVAPVVAPVVVKPTPSPKPHIKLTPLVKKPTLTDYRSGTVDEMLLKISDIEAENSESSKTIAATPLMDEPTIDPAILRKARKTHRFTPGLAVSITAALIILGVTGYVTYDTWRTNGEVKEKVAQTQTAEASVLGEGEDESEVAASAVDSYKVAADLPRVLNIESLNIRARVLPMSVTSTGAVQAPVNIFDSGWYTGSAKPGTKGAALIDAHASGATREGLFAYLDTLKEGNTITVERGDGEVLEYSVVHVETVELDNVDMGKLLKPYGDAVEGLNLITCTGTWVKDKNTYNKRVLVYTERI